MIWRAENEWGRVILLILWQAKWGGYWQVQFGWENWRLKIVRKILRSLPESFRAKVTAIEESKDLDDIKVQELIGSLQTYELSLPSQRKRKSLALKTINERAKAHDSSMRMLSIKMWHILWRISESSWSSRKMESLRKRENSQILERRKRISRGKMGRTLNLLRESCAITPNTRDVWVKKGTHA